MGTGMMIEGRWTDEHYHKDEKGRFQRNPTTFRHKITADGRSDFPATGDRYHLYVSLACPWAHRTLIIRKLKGLEKSIPVSIVSPLMLNEGWSFESFPGTIPDTVNGALYLREIYARAEGRYTGRVTVPVLWDKHAGTIVNNESREIVRMLDREFDALAENPEDFCPEELTEKIDATIDSIYQPINNGVYRAGFAMSQEAHEEAVAELFAALGRWNEVLGTQKYLCGDRLTEADIFLFTTLFRFDPVYYVHFKCNLRHIWDYPHLWRYLREIYHHEGIGDTCNLEHIKHHYYRSHPHLNPSGLVPAGPVYTL